MAERRMFSKTIVDSDAFLDMPLSTQCLYFHLAMRADDDGFVNNPKKIQRVIGASDDDMKILLVKRFLLAFDSGVVVVKHWRIHNYIQKDRYKPTVYQDEKGTLQLKENGVYTECIQDGNTGKLELGELGLGKDSIGEDRLLPEPAKADSQQTKREKRFTPPTLEEVRAYCQERQNGISPEAFIDYYQARGWELKKGQKVKDWKACMRTWERNGYNNTRPQNPNKTVLINEEDEDIAQYL